MNRRQAIQTKCLSCSGFSIDRVRNCPLNDCLLFPFRMGVGKQDPKNRDRAIRAYCVSCMGQQKRAVKSCPSSQCPLYPFRLSKRKYLDENRKDKRRARHGNK